MALHFTRDAYEMVQFTLRSTGEVVQVQSRFIAWMAKLVQVGEKHAISVTDALKAMGVENSGKHQRQWRHAADFWQEADVLVSATTKGYFIPGDETERSRCVGFKQVTIDALERRKHRLEQIPLGKFFPEIE